MKIVLRNIRVSPGTKPGDIRAAAIKKASSALSCGRLSAEICRKSVDTRHKTITLVYSVTVDGEISATDDELLRIDAVRLETENPFENIVHGSETSDGNPVVVGFGPCGMFAALALAEQGYRPIVLERGDSIYARTLKVNNFLKNKVLDPETNIQFGAGGAGTFSDGKLMTRINDKKTRYVLEKFVEFGAPSSILTDAKPHIGTDRLMKVVGGIDEKIRELGGTILYNTKMISVRLENGKAVSVLTTAGEIPCGQLILAIGHSSRDTVSYLSGSGFTVVPKPFSVGCRIEHLTEDIDRAIYGKYAGHPDLGHAEYALSHRKGEDCVYTFCMCPGGEVIAAASEEGGIVTNGMSRYARNGSNSNSALVVNCAPDDPTEFQRRLERKAFALGGGTYAAPFMTVGDFLSGKHGTMPSKVNPTYMSGNVVASDLSLLFPERITSMMKEGLGVFNGKIKGFASPEAILTGPETRTSSPVRICRTEEMTALGFDNIYPCGEGAGYAGGITSAAVDGVGAAIKIINRYKSI